MHHVLEPPKDIRYEYYAYINHTGFAPGLKAMICSVSCSTSKYIDCKASRPFPS